MIPRIIHQTWKDDRIPERFVAWSRSWRERNPGWEWILWTDRMLLEFVERHYPEQLATFAGYDQGIMRADAGRYMLLHRFGGVYADLDTECLAPLAAIESEDRVVLCHEPPVHWPEQAPYRGHPYILFNGIMASPAGHPFWRRVIDLLPLTRFGNDVLDVAGPCLLTGAQLDYDAQPPVRVDSCHLFCAEDKEGKQTVPYLPVTPSPLARHHWASTWWRPARRHGPLGTALRTAAFSMRHKLTRGRVLDGAQARAVVAPEVLARSAPSGNNVAILVPVRDAAAHIGPFFEKVQSLDHPKSAIKLVFCEGDSVDDTWDRVNVLASAHRAGYRNVVLARRHMGVEFSRQARWNRPLQRRRRAALAAVRNQLIDIGLDTTDDWALWIDVDVWQFPPDIIAHLIAAKARIVAPHCVRYPGGPTYDLNSFVARTIVPRYRYLKHLHDGLYQPPRSAWGRSYMDGLRHSSRVPLDGVGGTMLLVDAALHRGGLRFPELPYRDHIETEGLGLLARDLGVGAVGLPRVEILHAPW